MKKNLYAFLFFIFPFLTGSHPCFAQNLPEKSIDKIKKATVFINVKHQFLLTNEELNTSGSGFFINEKGWIATNYHVIRSSLADYNGLYPTKIKEINIIRNSGDTEYKTYSATIVSVDKESDIAILAVPDSAEKFPCMEMDTSKLSELMPVWIFGYPFGDRFTVLQRGPEITVNNGSISALRHSDKGELNKIQVDAVINHGNSGGPVVNEQGKVAGIINSMMGSSRINFAVPAHYLEKMRKQIPNDFSIAESTLVRIKTIPEEAEVFIDGEHLLPKGSGKEYYKRNGLHTLAVMKKGYESYIKEISFTGEYADTISLQPEKNLSVTANDNPDSYRDDKKDTSSSAAVNHAGDILMKENFDDLKTFDTWEQSTGGEKTRTWYMEDGMLHQFENNETLHAIYLGSKNWDNYTIKVNMKITNEGGRQDADSRAGIIFRETEDGFYLLRIHRESNKAQLAYHCKRPFGWFILTEKKLDDDTMTGKWYQLSASVNGDIIACFLDGKNLFNVNASYSSAGRVGLYSVESKPMFDSLTVVTTNSISAAHIAQPSSLVSFWFSDNFDLKSTWWHQYTWNDNGEKISPLYMVDGAYAITEENKNLQTMEFTRYKLQDFSMRLMVSLDKGKDDAVFEIFFRKEKQDYLSFRFEKKVRTQNFVSLVQHKNGKEKILKEKKISSKIFGSAVPVLLKADGNSVSIGSTYSDWLTYHNKKLLMNAGRIGFSSRELRIVFHQLALSSIAQPMAKEKGKK